jgi:hypothetical protein
MAVAQNGGAMNALAEYGLLGLLVFLAAASLFIWLS